MVASNNFGQVYLINLVTDYVDDVQGENGFILLLAVISVRLSRVNSSKGLLSAQMSAGLTFNAHWVQNWGGIVIVALRVKPVYSPE